MLIFATAYRYRLINRATLICIRDRQFSSPLQRAQSNNHWLGSPMSYDGNKTGCLGNGYQCTRGRHNSSNRSSLPSLLTIFTICASATVIAALPWENPMMLTVTFSFLMLGLG